jgi:rhodanese-related sulfurtransferase
MMKKTARALVEQTLARVTTYTAEQARALHGQPGVQFVDVRDVRELEREGAIPGAFHAPRGLVELWGDPESPPHTPELLQANDTQFILFCGAGWQSALATQALMDKGVAHVAHLEGGFDAWRKAGGPVEPPEPPRGS